MVLWAVGHQISSAKGNGQTFIFSMASSDFWLETLRVKKNSSANNLIHPCNFSWPLLMKNTTIIPSIKKNGINITAKGVKKNLNETLKSL